MENVVMFEIFNYVIIWRQLEPRDFYGQQIQIRGIVRCSGKEEKSGEGYTMDVMFLAPDSPFPQPRFEPENKRGYMFMPIDALPAFVDTLRNEKPIFGHLRGDRPEWTSVTTTQEPVGEGERSD